MSLKMTDGSEKRKRQLAFELQRSRVFAEKRSNSCTLVALCNVFFCLTRVRAEVWVMSAKLTTTAVKRVMASDQNKSFELTFSQEFVDLA